MENNSFFSSELKGKTALVTGGTKGIGRSIADKLLQYGATVIISARTQPETATEGLHFIAADASTNQGVAQLADAVIKQFGKVDILVNNAGGNGNPAGGFNALTDEQWLNTLNLNLMSAVRLDKALLPAMLEQQSGVIIHVSSGVGKMPFWEFTMPYAAAKAALNNYSKSLSSEVASKGVRVISVAPGMVKTDAMAAFIQASAEQAGVSAADVEQNMLNNVVNVPIGRLAQPEEVAELVAFLVSPRASYLTGVSYAVDGGALPVV